MAFVTQRAIRSPIPQHLTAVNVHLKAAIEQANSTPGLDTILIGVSNVLVNTVLPHVTAPVEFAPSGTSKAVLTGTQKTLNIQGGESRVENLIFQGVGLGISEKGNNVIRGNYIGAYDESTASSGTLGARNHHQWI